VGRRRQTTPSLGQTKTGAWRIRWRQDERQPDGSTKRVGRERQVATKAEAVRLQAAIQQHLEERGYWLESDTVATKPLDVSLAEAYGNRERSKANRWNPEGASQSTAFGEFKRFAAAWHVSAWPPARRAAATKRPTPKQLETWAMAGAREWVTSLEQQRFHETSLILSRWYAESTAFNSANRGLDLWRYVHLCGEAGVKPPPAEGSEVMPPPPFAAPPSAIATWTDTDQCLNRIRVARSLRMATIARYTGLRVSQVTAVHREHIDLRRRRLFVAKAKSRRERAMARHVALCPSLCVDLAPWLEQITGPLFPQKGDPSAPMKSPRNLTRYVTEAWELATADGAVAREVWSPLNRDRNMPDHAFRAAFQTHLLRVGNPDYVVQHLVGHRPSSTMMQHYATPALEVQAKAVASIPRVAWTKEALETLQLGGRRQKGPMRK